MKAKNTRAAQVEGGSNAHFLFIAVCVLSAGCGCPHEPGPLVTSDGWALVEAASDPFGDRLDQVDCNPSAYGAEDLGGEQVFSVDTVDCNYITVVQPAATDVCAGEMLKMRLWHFALSGGDESHVAVAIGGMTVWEERIPIPAASKLFVPRFEAPEITAGTPIHFHLHNHGSNSYSFIELSVEDE